MPVVVSGRRAKTFVTPPWLVREAGGLASGAFEAVALERSGPLQACFLSGRVC
jgi:hypothetical protein